MIETQVTVTGTLTVEFLKSLAYAAFKAGKVLVSEHPDRAPNSEVIISCHEFETAEIKNDLDEVELPNINTEVKGVKLNVEPDEHFSKIMAVIAVALIESKQGEGTFEYIRKRFKFNNPSVFSMGECLDTFHKIPFNRTYFTSQVKAIIDAIREAES